MGRGDGTNDEKIFNTHMSEIIERILLLEITIANDYAQSVLTLGTNIRANFRGSWF